MEGIVLELQKDALDEKVDINSLLRKAYLVAHKLKLKEFENWITQEQEGYKSKIPDYRYLGGGIKAYIPGTGWIAIVFSEETEEIASRLPFPNPISVMYDLYNSNETPSISFVLSSGVIESLSNIYPNATQFSFFSSKSELFRIINTVKNKVLEWSLLLEDNGINGEGLSFSEKEIEAAQESVVINNYTNNFYSDVSEVEIKQNK